MIIRFSPEAEEDPLAVWEFSRRQWGEEQADVYIDQILLRIGWLVGNPGLWHARPELGEGVHSYPAERHVIFFRRMRTRLPLRASCLAGWIHVGYLHDGFARFRGNAVTSAVDGFAFRNTRAGLEWCHDRFPPSG